MSEEPFEKKVEECKSAANRLFPSNLYEIKNVFPSNGFCLVDFKRKNYEPDIDCDEYCDLNAFSEEDYDDCKQSCKENVEAAVTSSIIFDPKTESIKESAITGQCGLSWFTAEETPEEEWPEKEKKLAEFEDKFRKIGCTISDSWVHPHELAPVGQEVEEPPAVCYYHPQASEQPLSPELKCKVSEVLKLIEENV